MYMQTHNVQTRLTVLDEVLDDLHEPSAAGQSQRSLLCLLGLSINVGPVFHQQLDDVLVTLTSSLHQRSVPARVHVYNQGFVKGPYPMKFYHNTIVVVQLQW